MQFDYMKKISLFSHCPIHVSLNFMCSLFIYYCPARFQGLNDILMDGSPNIASGPQAFFLLKFIFMLSLG